MNTPLLKLDTKTAPSQYATDEERWTAVTRRDAKADGQFYYSVKTTGVYCRPSCAARLALRENVCFHTTCADAERAGFRPCKRCKPRGPMLAARRAALVAEACRAIEASDELPNLNALAAKSGLSRFHFHRIFRSITGVTPKAYAMANREARMRDTLPRRETVTEVIYESGFNSNGRFYAKSAQSLGMKPKTFQNGGAGAAIRFAVAECSLGPILVAASDLGICAISLGDDAGELVRDLQHRFPKAELIGGDREFERTVAEVIGFVEAPGLGLNLPLDIRGTAFQQRVWQALRDIPAGSTLSYAEVARKIDAPKSVRAVAAACASNAIAVAIPCHRVIRTDGGISGYRWGVERKRMLLNREAA